MVITPSPPTNVSSLIVTPVPPAINHINQDPEDSAAETELGNDQEVEEDMQAANTEVENILPSLICS